MAKELQLSVTINSLPDDGMSVDEKQAAEGRQQDDTKATASQSLTKATRHRPPRHSKLYNIMYEGITFTKVYLKVRLNEIYSERPYKALTTAGRFNHYLVDPLSSWYGHNQRVLTSASLAQVEILSSDQSIQKAINGSSHNYAGFYSMSEEELELHRMCLTKLPVADVAGVSFLHGKMLEGLADFWDAKFCFSTGTGYQSNLLGIPAIAGKGWLILLDEKSHNSIFTACYLAGADAIKKFKHNDMKDLGKLLDNWRKDGNYTDILVVLEGLYSMDGTVPSLGAVNQLKNEYGFVVYVDEAHSFGSIGKSGRGILELWNDEYPGEPLPRDLIDVRSGALSKAVGGLGGFVCATSDRFEKALRTRSEDLQRHACGSLTTATILRTLSFLARPKCLQQNLLRLRDISTFCHDELKLQGIYVYGDEKLSHLPILPIFGGRPSKAAELSFMLRKYGIAAAPVSTPAVDIWESRVRVLISPSFTDSDVNNLVAATATASHQIGLGRRRTARRRTYCSNQNSNTKDIADETGRALLRLQMLLEEQVCRYSTTTTFPTCDKTIIDVGVAAQRQYGVGSGSSRLILGTFQPHLQVEELIAKITNQPSALTYPDSQVGHMSTVAALCRPVIGAKKHYFLLPANVPSSAEEGLQVASTKSKTVSIRYADLESMVPIFVALAACKDTYISLYIQPLNNGKYIDLASITARLYEQLPPTYRGCTILFDDSQGISHCGLQKLGIGRSVDLGRIRDLLLARILVSGSFAPFGLPGGWLAGNAELIEEFRFTSRGYMFSTSPMPFVMAMIKQNLVSLLR